MMSLKTLIDYFDKNGWPVGVNEEKLNDRYSISDELYKVGWEVIEIERHRAIMGTTYHKGMPMNAYQTFWMRYAVQAKSEEVEELPERSGKINIYNIY